MAAAAGLVAHCDGIPYPVGDAIADPLAGAHAAAAIDPATRTVAADPAEVVATGPGIAEVIATSPGTWAVRTASGFVPVSPPRARQPRSAAARLGRDTREVRAGLEADGRREGYWPAGRVTGRRGGRC